MGALKTKRTLNPKDFNRKLVVPAWIWAYQAERVYNDKVFPNELKYPEVESFCFMKSYVVIVRPLSHCFPICLNHSKRDHGTQDIPSGKILI